MFGASMVINRTLRPLKSAIGEGVGELVADAFGAEGQSRTRIINNSRRIVNIGGSLAVSAAIADATGMLDAFDALD
jgi:hypothetical protein